MSVPDGMEFNKSYSLPLDKDEKRMDIIGQNGNDGLHYDELTEEEKKLDLNKDGIVDNNERLLAIQNLEKLAYQAKMSGNTSLYEVYKSQINEIKF